MAQFQNQKVVASYNIDGDFVRVCSYDDRGKIRYGVAIGQPDMRFVKWGLERNPPKTEVEHLVRQSRKARR